MGSLKIDHSIFGTCYGFTTSGVGLRSRNLVRDSLRHRIAGTELRSGRDDDLDLIGTRRRPENRLGLALHIALLRHPGQGWHDDTEPPAPLVAWLARARQQGAAMKKSRMPSTVAQPSIDERLTC